MVIIPWKNNNTIIPTYIYCTRDILINVEIDSEAILSLLHLLRSNLSKMKMMYTLLLHKCHVESQSLRLP